MKLHAFLLLNCFLAELPHLNFNKLSETVQQEVIVRGFLYQNARGDWILAAEPNLKTCCVGSPEKMESQIFVAGDVSQQVGQPKAGRVYTLQGTFEIEHLKDSSGNLLKLYHLKNAKLK